MFEAVCRRLPLVMALAVSMADALADSASTRLTDPTRPPQSPVVEVSVDDENTEPALRLQAVFTGPKGEAALINGQLINRGQRVAGALLRQVHSNGVLLERDGQTWEMPLGVSSIKQPAGNNRSTSP